MLFEGAGGELFGSGALTQGRRNCDSPNVRRSCGLQVSLSVRPVNGAGYHPNVALVSGFLLRWFQIVRLGFAGEGDGFTVGRPLQRLHALGQGSNLPRLASGERQNPDVARLRFVVLLRST